MLPNEIIVITRPQKDGTVKTFYRLTISGDISFDKIFHSKDEALAKYYHFFPKSKIKEDASPALIKSKEALPNLITNLPVEFSSRNKQKVKGVQTFKKGPSIFHRVMIKKKDLSFNRIFKDMTLAVFTSNVLRSGDEKYINLFLQNLPFLTSPNWKDEFYNIDNGFKLFIKELIEPINIVENNFKNKSSFEENKEQLSKKMVLPKGITKQKIEKSLKIFNNSESWQDFFNKIGEIYSQENFYKYKLYFKMLGFSVSGKLKGARVKVSEDEVFVENSIFHRSTVKRKIISQKLLPYECSVEGCGNKGEWLGKPISLHLEHKNGIPSDNRLENLTFLCPNCHSQTETYSGKSKKVKNKIGGDRINKAKEWAKSKGGQCLSEEYESAQKKMKWKCEVPEHPIWETSYSKIMNDKSWCPACVRGNNQFTKLLNKKN